MHYQYEKKFWLTHNARPGVEYPTKVHSIGWELYCEVFNCSFIIAVLNSVGVNVTAMHVLPWAGTIPKYIYKKDIYKMSLAVVTVLVPLDLSYNMLQYYIAQIFDW